ncbi:MAG: hypothetical protein IH899_05385 [Planctomycetes bacterium]|nr:hypothetical protein [Planctomycetota bacterium]
MTLLSCGLRAKSTSYSKAAVAIVHGADDDHAFGMPAAWCVMVVAAGSLRRLRTLPQCVFVHRDQGMAGSQRDLPLLPTYRWA